MKILSLKEIQQIELNLLLQFKQVCEKNNLKYALSGGTLLGAIRHQGFIPWDDDIDIIMPRPDFDKLVHSAKNDMPNWVKIVNPELDPHALHPYMKIMDTRTTLIERPNDKKFIYSIYIDVFVADGVPTDKEKQVKHENRAKALSLLRYICVAARYNAKQYKGLKKIIWTIINIVQAIIPKTWLWKLLDQHMRKYMYGATEFCSVVGIASGVKEIMPFSEYVHNRKTVNFEGHTFYGLENNDKYLKGMYGDYMSLPPLEKQKKYHDNIAYYK